MIIFRFDANPSLGFGHLARCRELARELYARDHEVALYGAPCDVMTDEDSKIFSAWQGSEPWQDSESDAAALLQFGQLYGAKAYILDDFRVDEAYQLVLRQAGARWLQFEGQLKRPIWADLLFCANAAANPEAFAPYIRNERCGLLVGLRYALLRKEFRNLPERTTAETVRRVFVSFGGGSDRGAVEFVLQALLARFPRITFCVISGLKNPNNNSLQTIAREAGTQVELHIGAQNVADVMCSCDFAVMAAGTTTLEAIAAELPMLLVTIAKNQISPAEACSEQGAAIYVGPLGNLDETLLVDAFKSMLDPDIRTGQVKAMRALGIDGAGVFRVADAIEAMLVAHDRA